MSSPLETLFVVWYLGMTQSTCESRPLAFTELQGSLGEVIWLFSGSVVRRLCSLLESTRGMCYRQRAGIGCWVAKATCSAGLYALMCPLECTQLLLHGTTMYCASSLSRMVWDPLVLFCMLKGLSNSRGQRGSLPQTRRGLTLLSQLCRDPAVGVRNAEEA